MRIVYEGASHVALEATRFSRGLLSDGSATSEAILEMPSQR